MTVGDGWNESYAVNNRGLVKVHDRIKIPSHGSIVVEVGEEIKVPHNKYGVVMPTGRLFLSNGILTATAKVEPAFAGKLKLRLYNTTSKTVFLNKGETLASVIFFRTETSKVHEAVYRISEILETSPGLVYVVRKFFSTNKTQLLSALVVGLIMSIFTLTITYVAYYRPMMKMQSAKQQPVDSPLVKTPQAQKDKQ